MVSSKGITCYFDLLFSCRIRSSKDLQIQFDPELFFDYCEICEIKCDSGLPHNCIYKLRGEDEVQEQFQFPNLSHEE